MAGPSWRSAAPRGAADGCSSPSTRLPSSFGTARPIRPRVYRVVPKASSDVDATQGALRRWSSSRELAHLPQRHRRQISVQVGPGIRRAAAAGLLLVNGRIAGISGLVVGATSPRPQAYQWAFLLGLVAAGVGAMLAGHPAPAALGARGFGILAVAGLLVGLGARLSGGCTSGHGVCGLGNLSLLSLVATLTFMITAGVVVFAARHLAPVGAFLAQAGLS